MKKNHATLSWYGGYDNNFNDAWFYIWPNIKCLATAIFTVTHSVSSRIYLLKYLKKMLKQITWTTGCSGSKFCHKSVGVLKKFPPFRIHLGFLMSFGSLRCEMSRLFGVLY